ncbi:DNA-directed RNA polymerase sigma-70 factor [Methylopila jiangsuensis]|uniref:DNA-directed RNA polymerase sigma-70 factor n=1 Tax=Methylopila jiangsuensis TaxID=586230 RepID=A0A9W6N2Q1_9HYPH|nr:sigma-70 family RNA polymerase sigma factor [Methylopila jiangsuensis]MDR6285763.1 RNA polymerase sigma-70 factor (ECF subfamily) [Methylopila jiangsuensis]GLK75520.1 DNA-directed RNA polymerase sigma-70 factor [Methylopila jiangsuensis]
MTSWRTSLGLLFVDHRAPLERLVGRRVRDRETAAEIVQDVFARVWRAGSAGSSDDDRRILYAAARNAAVDHNLAQSRRSRALARLTPEQLMQDDAAPDQTLASRAAIVALEEALADLPERTRAIFVARRLRGESNAVIAARLGISVRAVEKHLVRGLAHCRERLSGHLDDA